MANRSGVSKRGRQKKQDEQDRCGVFWARKSCPIMGKQETGGKPGFSKTINQNVGLLMCKKKSIKIIW